MTTTSVNPRRLAVTITACLALSVVFFAPRLWLMRQYVPGSFQWDRAHAFLLQCQEPLRRDIEPAMQWRLLPPLVAHGLHLPGKTPLLLPWLGLIAATTYAAVLFRRRLDDWRFVAGGTLLFATTSAVLVPVGWLGINDAWVWLGLLAVAFSRGRWAVPLACLLCPWIDERFLIGFPLAWLVARHERDRGWSWPATREALWLLPYVAIRLLLPRVETTAAGSASQFLDYQLRHASVLLPLAPLGWWMGLRAAWVAVGYAAWQTPPGRRLLGFVTLLATLGVTFLLASDLSRSIAILMPVVFLGCFTYARRHPQTAPRTLLILGIANLVIPAAHVVHLHIDLINPLPLELIRFFRPA